MTSVKGFGFTFTSCWFFGSAGTFAANRDGLSGEITIKMIKQHKQNVDQRRYVDFGDGSLPPPDVIAIYFSVSAEMADNVYCCCAGSPPFFLSATKPDLVDILLSDSVDRLDHPAIIDIDTALDINDTLFGRLVFHTAS